MLFKKSITNQGILDLHNYTSQALSEIKSIKNVGVLIVADGDGDEKYTNALSRINMKNIGTKTYVPSGCNLCTINGSAVLTNETVMKNAVYLVNGIAIVYDLSEEMNISLCTNGTVILQKQSNANILFTNGEICVTEFNGKDIKLFENKVTIDANFVNEATKGTIVTADNKIIIENDVTADMLSEKDMQFISGNKIICRKELWGYVQNHAHISNKIEEPKK